MRNKKPSFPGARSLIPSIKLHAVRSVSLYGLVFLFFAHIFRAQCQAETFYVSTNSFSNGPGITWSNAFHAIQDAINTASDGDTIWVTNGTYYLETQITATNAVIIKSVNGADVTIVDGQNTSRCFYVSNPAVIDGFTVKNGDAGWSHGGGIHCSGGGTIQNCVIVSNTAAENSGGGVQIDGFFSGYGGTVSNCLIINNVGRYGGGSVVIMA